MSKDIICNWLGKCKQKALDSVKAEVFDYLDIAECENPDLAQDIIRLENCMYSSKELKDKYGVMNCYVQKPYTYADNVKGKYFLLDGKYSLIYKFLQKNQGKDLMYETYLEEVSKLINKYYDVASEYNSLIATVKKMRNVKSMLSYLEGLGFDISTIKDVPKDTIDKNLLFVCGDNKPC